VPEGLSLHKVRADALRPILVTGSVGFVGTHLMPLLRAAFPDVPVIPSARRPTGDPDVVATDLTDFAATERMIAETHPSVVVHLAAHSSVGQARFAPDRVWRDNRNGSYTVAAALARHAPDATVLVASTGEVYGRSFRLGPATEETTPRPVGPYAHSKLVSEFIFASVLPDSAKVIAARPMNHVGAGQSETFVIASFAAQIARIEAGLVPPVIRVGNLSARRDFLDVRDVAASYIAILERADALPPRSIVNVGRGEAVSIERLLQLLLSLASVEVTVEVDPARLRPNDIPVASVRADRLAALAPWPPARTLEATLADVLAFQRRKVSTGVLQA
jgi:GDP-4-dehydro-6-deoxy-D-mannose reductase